MSHIKDQLERRAAALATQSEALRTLSAHAADSGITIRVGATMAEIERTAVLATLVHVNWNRQGAARVLGLSRRTILTRIHEWAQGTCLRCRKAPVESTPKIVGTCAGCAAEIIEDLRRKARRLSAEGRHAVRQRLAAGEDPHALAAEYNVSVKTIRHVRGAALDVPTDAADEAVAA